MKRTIRTIGIVTSLILLAFTSGCDEDPPGIDLPKHEIMLMLNHQWDGTDLKVNDWYVTTNDDSFQFTKLVYHINNFEFIDDKGNAFPADSKWFMVNSEGSLKPNFTMGDLQDKEFVSVRFEIGVADSAVNADGALNAIFTEPMYWGMANGYINFKLEGKSPSVGNGGVVLHTGGYLGNLKALAKVKIDFPTGKTVSSKIGSNNLIINVNLAEYFDNPNLIDLAVTNEIHTPSADAVRISENWPSMYSFGSIK